MPVFFISARNISHHHITIDGPLFHHLTKSLRFQEGDKFVVCDETRWRHHLIIQKITKGTLEGEILKSEQGPPLAGVNIILAQAMLKGDHMTWAIQKTTELGVSTIVPLLTERVIIRPKADRYQSLQERYSRIALDAAQQSERWDVPEVVPPTPLPNFLEHYCQAKLKCMLSERKGSLSLSSLPLTKEFQGTVILLIGPEGGWTQEEQQTARRFGFHSISLGMPILRGETASLVTLSIIQYRLGNLE